MNPRVFDEVWFADGLYLCAEGCEFDLHNHYFATVVVDWSSCRMTLRFERDPDATSATPLPARLELHFDGLTDLAFTDLTDHAERRRIVDQVAYTTWALPLSNRDVWFEPDPDADALTIGFNDGSTLRVRTRTWTLAIHDRRDAHEAYPRGEGWTNGRVFDDVRVETGVYLCVDGREFDLRNHYFVAVLVDWRSRRLTLRFAREDTPSATPLPPSLLVHLDGLTDLALVELTRRDAHRRVVNDVVYTTWRQSLTDHSFWQAPDPDADALAVEFNDGSYLRARAARWSVEVVEHPGEDPGRGAEDASKVSQR